MSLEQVTEDFQRSHIAELLAQCTPFQQTRLHELYAQRHPKRTEFAVEDLGWIAALIERTIAANEITP